MAKHKYKLGTFVKTRETTDQASHYGAVEEITFTAAGIYYKLTGLEDPVTEEEIEQGYRPIVARKTKTVKKSKKLAAA